MASINLIYIKGAVVITFLAFAYQFYLWINRTRRGVVIAESRLLQIEKNLSEIIVALANDSKFLRHSFLASCEVQLNSLKVNCLGLKHLFLRKRSEELLRKIEVVISDLANIRNHTNNRFFEREKRNASNIFEDANGSSLLTEEQLRAVLCNDNRNLVIAGAGSGKTRVIDFKVRYLVNYKNVDPDKILLLSFSRKSANDLINKISEHTPGVTVKTIHAFSSQILGNHGGRIFDEKKNEFGSFVINALTEALKDKVVFASFEKFYETFFTEIKPLIFYENINELRSDLKKVNSKLINIPDPFGELKLKRALKTLRGEYVRSVDERYIADFLYLQDIKYEYEPRFTGIDTPYYPDFYLIEHKAYLEHFAITASGGPPPYFANPKIYMAGIEWKRKLHYEKNTRLIESYSYLLNEKGSSNYLSELLQKNGIPTIDLMGNEKVLGKLSREFSRIFTRFYNSFKLSGFSISELNRKYSIRRYFLFLQIFESFLTHFNRLAADENKMDFNDLLVGAVAKIKNEGCRNYDYIIVDEFQDTSNLAMQLLEAVLKNNTTATFYCVGDDWQSIYGFNGSDVTILSEFEKRYPGASVAKLNYNFRSHSKIVELGKRFITKNPAQIYKEVVSQNPRFSESEIAFLSFTDMEEKIQSIPEDQTIFVIYRYNDDCPADRGIFKKYFLLDRSGRPIKRSTQGKNLSLMTIHASKGLEAQHVFILFPESTRRKFPSEIEEHFVFNMLKTSDDEYPFSEERRLMYVAITRAEQNLYFVAPSGKSNSNFWDELKTLNQFL